MNMLRHSIILVVLLGFEPSCFANKKAYIPQFTPPVQNYAVIDISGDTPAGNPVDNIALNDANVAAFMFHAGDVLRYLFSDDAIDKTLLLDCLGTTLTSYQFSNGTLTPVQNLNYETEIDFSDPPFGTGFDMYVIDGGVLSSGNMCGIQGKFHNDVEGTHYVTTTVYGCPGGSPSLIGEPGPYETWGYIYYDLRGVCDSGYCVGFDGSGYIQSNSSTVIFDPTAVGMDDQVDDTKIVGADFSPFVVNNKGSSVGDSFWEGVEFWDGNTLAYVADDDTYQYRYPTYALNDQNQVSLAYTLMTGVTDTSDAEGFLWENDGANITTLRDTLPYWFEWQDWDVEPFAISNQIKEAPAPPLLPDPSSDATIHLLATAQGVDVGAYGTMLYTRDNNGKWTYANVALPQGTSITNWTSINSSGVIAAIGNAGTGDGHALLLVPDPLIVTAPIQGTWSQPSNAGTSTPTLFGYQHSAKETYPALAALAKGISKGGIWRDIRFIETITFAADQSTLTCRSQGFMADTGSYQTAGTPDGSNLVWPNDDRPNLPIPQAMLPAISSVKETVFFRWFFVVTIAQGSQQVLMECDSSYTSVCVRDNPNSTPPIFHWDPTSSSSIPAFSPVPVGDPPSLPSIEGFIWQQNVSPNPATRTSSSPFASAAINYISTNANWHAVGGVATSYLGHFPNP